MIRRPFSARFPATHRRKGELTFFPERIWAHLILNRGHTDLKENVYHWLVPYWKTLTSEERDLSEEKLCEFVNNKTPKIHTIRKGDGYYKGMSFAPYVWSGRPYKSPQIVFTPALVVEKTTPIIVISDRLGTKVITADTGTLSSPQVLELVKNDGIDNLKDFQSWFTKGLAGNIVYF